MAESTPCVQAIDRKSVHQICSGQVVLNLATAVKELVENSLDAGATNIEIRLKESGSESLEVVDNGSGVEPGNFDALTLKHYTSKLRDFSDLASVDTFGFRGEALSSLCALSDLSIVTRHLSQTAGTKLEYDHNGKLVKQSPCARECGTTVTLQSLFYTLPVRHKEFLRNLKRELTKLVHILQGYCLVSTGVRITCSNQQEKGRKIVICSTNGGMNIKDNITCVFGAKQVQNIMPFSQNHPTTEDCAELGVEVKQISQETNPFCIAGFVSKPDHGAGRSSADRQFFFINKRPCDLSKVSRSVNEVYHMYNRHQYPFVMMDISLARDNVDVNVTPDKRQVFVQQEKLLLATIKASLKTMFEPYSSNYAVNEKPLTQLKMGATKDIRSAAVSRGSSNGEGRSGSAESEEGNSRYKKSWEHLKTGFPSLSGFKRLASSLGGAGLKSGEPRCKQAKLTKLVVKRPQVRSTHSGENSCNAGEMPSNALVDDCTPEEAEQSECEVGGGADIAGKTENLRPLREVWVVGQRELPNEEKREHTKAEETSLTARIPGKEMATESCKVELVMPKLTATVTQSAQVPNIFAGRKEMSVDFSMRTLKAAFGARPTAEKKIGARTFRAKINPESNRDAEEELRRQVDKTMFSQMEILGQFNLGFIITKLGGDLFIIDQHASDEKFNFETQQRNTTLQSQRLVVPQRLELTATNECILIDNLEIFRKNGFDFDIDETAEATRRVKLSALPISKNWAFGVEDVEELIFMLSDSPGVACRPSRVRKMFASRACRMSVMVGTALDRAQMRRVVSHMGEIEQPWNCPHGRPTMRHLINLGMISDAFE